MADDIDELNDLKKLLAPLASVPLSPRRGEFIRQTSLKRLSTGKRWDRILATTPEVLTPALAETAAVGTLAGIYLAWALARAASLLGVV